MRSDGHLRRSEASCNARKQRLCHCRARELGWPGRNWDSERYRSYCEPLRKRGHNRDVIRDASTSDLPAIRELLARANDGPYDLVKVAEEKCFGAGFEGRPAVRIFGDFDGISVTCGKSLRIFAVDRTGRQRGIGTTLLRDAESRGASVIAAEPGNYFTPGVSESVAQFFRKRGYVETARTHNLIVDELPMEDSGPPLSGQPRAAVLHFIEKNFGPIWRFEAERGAQLFAAEDAGEIVGFSTHEANNRGLRPFGPTGVRS